MSHLNCLVSSYKKYFGEEANSVLEIGSRDGHDSYYLSLRFDCKNTYTIEANPKCHNIINVNYPQFKNIYGAASNFTGTADFNAVDSNNWDEVGTSSLRNRNDSWYSGKANKIQVPVDTLENYIELHNIVCPIDILKIDVEGCSYEVLEGFGKYLKQIKSMHIENETIAYWEDQKLADDVGELLVSNGFFKDYEEKFGENSVDEVWINGNLL